MLKYILVYEAGKTVFQVQPHLFDWSPMVLVTPWADPLFILSVTMIAQFSRIFSASRKNFLYLYK